MAEHFSNPVKDSNKTYKWLLNKLIEGRREWNDALKVSAFNNCPSRMLCPGKKSLSIIQVLKSLIRTAFKQKLRESSPARSQLKDILTSVLQTKGI